MNGFMCSSPIYQYDGWTFEYGMIGGPWPIRKDGELFKRAGAKFWNMFSKFMAEEDQETFRVGGGCDRFTYE